MKPTIAMLESSEPLPELIIRYIPGRTCMGRVLLDPHAGPSRFVEAAFTLAKKCLVLLMVY